VSREFTIPNETDHPTNVVMKDETGKVLIDTELCYLDVLIREAQEEPNPNKDDDDVLRNTDESYWVPRFRQAIINKYNLPDISETVAYNFAVFVWNALFEFKKKAVETNASQSPPSTESTPTN